MFFFFKDYVSFKVEDVFFILFVFFFSVLYMVNNCLKCLFMDGSTDVNILLLYMYSVYKYSLGDVQVVYLEYELCYFFFIF